MPYFIDIDLDSASNMEDDIKAYANKHATRIVHGIPGHKRYVFEDIPGAQALPPSRGDTGKAGGGSPKFLADNFINLLETHYILYTAYSRSDAKRAALRRYHPGAGISDSVNKSNICHV